jgi:hypothetical protein
MVGPTLAVIIIFPLLGLLSFILNPYWLKLKIKQFKKRDIKYKHSKTPPPSPSLDKKSS